jgi:hypothetical protein
LKYLSSIPSQSNAVRERSKKIQIGKEMAKLFLHADDIILYLKVPKDSTKKLLDLINTFRKVIGYNINIQKSIAFQYTMGWQN